MPTGRGPRGHRVPVSWPRWPTARILSSALCRPTTTSSSSRTAGRDAGVALALQVDVLLGDPSKAIKVLGWNPTKTPFPKVEFLPWICEGMMLSPRVVRDVGAAKAHARFPSHQVPARTCRLLDPIIIVHTKYNGADARRKRILFFTYSFVILVASRLESNMS